MKIIMIYDQIQSGLGTKDDTMVPLTGKKEPIGPAVMMEPFLKQVDGHVIASDVYKRQAVTGPILQTPRR